MDAPPRAAGNPTSRLRVTAVLIVAAAISLATAVAVRHADAGVVVVVPGCAVPPADVVAWWPLDADLTARIGPDLTGSVTFEPALIGDGARLSAVNTVAADPFPPVSGGVSLDMWIRPTFTGLPQVLASRWDFPTDDDASGAFALMLIGDDLVWLTDETSTLRPEELRVPTTGLYDGDFHHVAATWSPLSMAVYVDGFVVASKPSQGGTLNAASGTPFRLGSKVGIGDPLRYSGVIDEPAVYRRALTAVEVDDIAAAGPGGKCTATEGIVGPGLQFQADLGGVDPVVSANARYVLVRTRATDLFPVVTDPLLQTPGTDLDITGSTDDLVLIDTKNTSIVTTDDTIELVNVDSNELGGGLDAADAAMTPNATHVAFTSISDDLVPGDTLAGRDLFVRNRVTGTTERASVRTDGSQPEFTATGTNNDNRAPSISDGGTVVAFESTNRGLVPEANPTPGDTWRTYDVYVRDTSAVDPAAWFTERITVGFDGSPANGSSSSAELSPDGRYVWFSSAASNLVPDDTNGHVDLFRFDRQTDTIVRVNTTGATGLPLDGDVFLADVSPNGRYVAFSSDATTIVPGDVNGQLDAFVIDVQAPAATGVAKMSPPGAAEADGPSVAKAVSATGRYVLVESQATNLVVGDTNGVTDLFVADRSAQTVQRISVDPGGQQRDGASFGGASSSSLTTIVSMFQRSGDGLITIWRTGVQLT